MNAGLVAQGARLPTRLVFGEAESFEAALRAEGFTGLLVTEAGGFRSRLTQITLNRLRLASAEEELALTPLQRQPVMA